MAVVATRRLPHAGAAVSSRAAHTVAAMRAPSACFTLPARTLCAFLLLPSSFVRRSQVTKRDLFYTDVKLFKQQTESDDVLDDAACMIGCTRSSLNVVASEKGIVVGKLIFDDDGDTIDCTKMGVGGKAIPPSIDRVTNIRGDAEFILLIEKDAAFMRLAEDRFYNQFPCVIISGKGQPDVATRLFLNKVRRAACCAFPSSVKTTPTLANPDPCIPSSGTYGAQHPDPRPLRRRPVR